VQTACMGHMVATESVWKKKRADLKARRDFLFKEYTRHPHDVRLSLEIKRMDDEIVDCTHKMEEETRSSRPKRP